VAEYKNGKYVGKRPAQVPTMDELADKTHPPPSMARRMFDAVVGAHPMGKAMGDVNKALAPKKPKK
jgi:hypothetical protein